MLFNTKLFLNLIKKNSLIQELKFVINAKKDQLEYIANNNKLFFVVNVILRIINKNY